jgi:thymidylate synthase (FAD)
MRVVKASFEIQGEIDGEQILRNIEAAGRTCYKSEAKATPNSARLFIHKIIANGHESVLEHEKVTVRIICDRGVSHEIVRHRLASYSQESTRYCDYSKDGDLTFILPCWLKADPQHRPFWEASMLSAEQDYRQLRAWGWSPQQARCVLPNSLKTEVVMTANLREWRHFFRLRTSPAAHPQMREIAIPMLRAFQSLIPVVFNDCEDAEYRAA